LNFSFVTSLKPGALPFAESVGDGTACAPGRGRADCCVSPIGAGCAAIVGAGVVFGFSGFIPFTPPGDCAGAVRKPGQMNVNNVRAINSCFLTLVLLCLGN
jgi:hypothetical protein